MIGYLEFTDQKNGTKRSIPVGYALACQIVAHPSGVGCYLVPADPHAEKLWLAEDYEDVRKVMGGICEEIHELQKAQMRLGRMAMPTVIRGNNGAQ